MKKILDFDSSSESSLENEDNSLYDDIFKYDLVQKLKELNQEDEINASNQSKEKSFENKIELSFDKKEDFSIYNNLWNKVLDHLYKNVIKIYWY